MIISDDIIVKMVDDKSLLFGAGRFENYLDGEFGPGGELTKRKTKRFRK